MFEYLKIYIIIHAHRLKIFTIKFKKFKIRHCTHINLKIKISLNSYFQSTNIIVYLNYKIFTKFLLLAFVKFKKNRLLNVAYFWVSYSWINSIKCVRSANFRYTLANLIYETSSTFFRLSITSSPILELSTSWSSEL